MNFGSFIFINAMPKYRLISCRRETIMVIETPFKPVVPYLIIKCFPIIEHNLYNVWHSKLKTLLKLYILALGILSYQLQSMT